MVHFSVHVYIEVDLLALLLPNMLFMVYKGSWILKTRGIPYTVEANTRRPFVLGVKTDISACGGLSSNCLYIIF